MSKTIFVLLDACGYQIGTDNLGYLEHLADCGMAAKYMVRGELPSMSRPMYDTLMTGVQSHVHGITCNEVIRRSNQENIFSLCKKAGLVTGAAAYSWFSELYCRAPFNKYEDRIQLPSKDGLIDYGVYYWDDNYLDSHLFADGEFIRKTYKPDFMLYHPMSIDVAGHAFGKDSNEYASAIASMGYLIAGLIPEWLEAGYQVVVSADHGMDNKGLHCGTPDAQRNVPLYICSPVVENGHFEEEYVTQRNVAPLLCKLLGIKASEGMISPDEIRFK